MSKLLLVLVTITCWCSGAVAHDEQAPRVRIGPVIGLDNTPAGDSTAISCPIEVTEPSGVRLIARLLLFRGDEARQLQSVTHEWQGPKDVGEVRGNVLIFRHNPGVSSNGGQGQVLLVSGFRSDSEFPLTSGAGGSATPWSPGRDVHQWWQAITPADFPENEEVVVGVFGTERSSGKLRSLSDLKQAAAEGRVILACVLKWQTVE